MLVMENPEEVLQILERFTKLKPREIPQELEDYIRHVAKTGDTVYRWPNIKYLFREKLVNVIKQFHESTPTIDDLPQYPNVDPFNYETMKNGLLERLDTFNAAPFTIQRISELLSDPRKQYTRIDKFMRALEKNILVVSTIEPGRKTTDSENGDSLDSMMNGDLPNEVDVDIDMPNTALPSINTLTPSAAVIMAEVAMAAKIATTNRVKSPTPEDDVDLPHGLEVSDIEPDVNITDSIGKFEEAEEGATKDEPAPEISEDTSSLVIIKPSNEAETKEKDEPSEETREDDEKETSQVEVKEKDEKDVSASEEIKVDVISEEVEKSESTNVGISSSSSSSEDSNSTDDNESLTGQSSDAEAASGEEKTQPEVSEPVAEVVQTEEEQPSVEKPEEVHEEESKSSDFSDEEKNTEVIDPVGTTEEDLEEKLPTEKVSEPEPPASEESTTEGESSLQSETSPSDDLAFHPTDSSSVGDSAPAAITEESRDRNEDGEPVCKKPMESDMLIEVPPALPLEEIPTTTSSTIDVVSQMVADEALLESAKIEASPLTDVSSAPPPTADLVLPLDVADMEVAPATSEVSEMATEDDNSVPMKTDDAMEVDECSMEPMDQ